MNIIVSFFLDFFFLFNFLEMLQSFIKIKEFWINFKKYNVICYYIII